MRRSANGIALEGAILGQRKMMGIIFRSCELTMAKSKKGGDIVDKFLNGTNWKWGNFNMLPILFGVVMATIDVVMMGAVKMTHEGTLSHAFGVPFALFFYALEPLIFLKAMNYEGMAVTNLIWNLASDVVVTFGHFLFR